MSEFRFVFYGEPVAQGRPKFSTWGGHVSARDPEKSKNYKEMLRISARQHLQNTQGQKLHGALSLSLTIYRQVPKSWSRRQTEKALQNQLLPITKPDVSNYLKGVEDALNAVVYDDDSQITTINATKLYSNNPRIEVVIAELEPLALTKNNQQEKSLFYEE